MCEEILLMHKMTVFLPKRSRIHLLLEMQEFETIENGCIFMHLRPPGRHTGIDG